MTDSPANRPPLRIVKKKISWQTGELFTAASWDVEALGADAHGTWLGSRRGTSVTLSKGQVEQQRDDGVWLFPADGYWVAAFWFTADTDLTIDISLPATWVGATWMFTDLELDLYRNAQGVSGIVDQDEFMALAATGHVHEDVLAAAIHTADRLLEDVSEGGEPFGSAARAYMDALRHGL